MTTLQRDLTIEEKGSTANRSIIICDVTEPDFKLSGFLALLTSVLNLAFICISPSSNIWI